MFIIVQKVIQDLVANVQRATPGYQVDANTAQVIQAPASLCWYPWLSDRDATDDPNSEVLFVHSGTITEVFCLLEDFFVREEVACPPKFFMLLLLHSLQFPHHSRCCRC